MTTEHLCFNLVINIFSPEHQLLWLVSQNAWHTMSAYVLQTWDPDYNHHQYTDLPWTPGTIFPIKSKKNKQKQTNKKTNILRHMEKRKGQISHSPNCFQRALGRRASRVKEREMMKCLLLKEWYRYLVGKIQGKYIAAWQKNSYLCFIMFWWGAWLVLMTAHAPLEIADAKG